jgi:hypothetical protein
MALGSAFGKRTLLRRSDVSFYFVTFQFASQGHHIVPRAAVSWKLLFLQRSLSSLLSFPIFGFEALKARCR